MSCVKNNYRKKIFIKKQNPYGGFAKQPAVSQALAQAARCGGFGSNLLLHPISCIHAVVLREAALPGSRNQIQSLHIVILG